MMSDAETLRRRAETARRLRAGVGVLSSVTLQRLDYTVSSACHNMLENQVSGLLVAQNSQPSFLCLE